MHWTGLATFWFGDAGPVRAAPAVPGRDDDLQDIFVRGVLPVVLIARGLEALHASAVVLDSVGAIALCATSGTGKSTVALALAAAGARHLADDTVVYCLSDHRATVLSLPHPVRVEPAARLAAGLPGDIPRSPEAPDTCEPLSRVYQLVRRTGLDPRVPQFRPVLPHRAFDVLLTHAHPFEMADEGRRRVFIERLLALAGTVGVWECRFSPSLDALPALAAAIRAHASVS